MGVHLLLVRSRRRLPVELLAELCDCVPHHRLGLAKLVTSYSSCPVGLLGVHLTAQNGAPSIQLFTVSTLLTKLLREKREKMIGPINKWNENELEMYNKWKAESVHLITLLEEVKRLHASK
uniref:SCY1-like protein 2 n=1 Tax=Globodera pallida TaxID=36090 RepID=A0A183CAS1_GLOPA